MVVTSEEHNVEEEFNTRTEFYGRKRSRDGGWLESYNKASESNLSHEDFVIKDLQIPHDFSTAKMIADKMIKRDVDLARMDSVKFYVGVGDVYREEKSTLIKYKGNRDGTIKPVYLKPLTEYLTRKYNATEVSGIECDDRLVMEAYKRPDRVIVGVDKDFYAQPVKFFNCNKPEEGVIKCTGLGELRIDGSGSKKQVRGFGRKFLYWQMCAGDTADNFKAACFSKKNFGAISGYKALVDCKTEKECWESLINVFKLLYPEPKTITGWRGDDFEIDWRYVLNEQFQMARMLRFEGDEVEVDSVLKGLGIDK